MTKKKGKIKYSVQLTFVLTFFVFIGLLIGLLNIYPTTSSRDIVFSTKRGSMMSQASVVSASLSALERLSGDGVAQVMELIDVNAFDRVIITDEQGGVLYDTRDYGTGSGRALYTEIVKALGGEAVFSSHFDGDAFYSRTAAPVISYGDIIGAVYLYEEDADQAALINEIQGRLRNISLLAGSLALFVILVLTTALTRRIRELVKAMRIVREGNYEHRLPVKGSDEVSELAEEFNNMAQRLQSTEELRRRFVSDASHELRTPLASIRLLSDSIVQSETMDEATMREFVTDIGTEAERLQRTTEKLMMLTRMDSKVQAPPVRVDMKRVAERTIHLLDPLAREKNITIYTDLAEGCVIMATEDDIYQIIFNLAENALKYNNFGGNVFIRLRREEKNARLLVEDTGIGIPEKDIPHIFSRFYRVDKARSRAQGGSGLGLSIVHDAVECYGGTISVERRETVGTRFTVIFPLAEASEKNKQGEQA
ncbi:MAG: sensor histidine kinase [Oscillospiraceae bacterium]